MIPTHIVVHHSATGNEVTFEQIRENHRKRGWDDIGYHFVINPSGTVLQGRAEDVVGAHALGMNQHSLGVCCIGNFEEREFGPVQRAALVNLLRDLCERHGIREEQIIGHCDVTCEERGGRRSLCPGKYLYRELTTIRLEVNNQRAE